MPIWLPVSSSEVQERARICGNPRTYGQSFERVLTHSNQHVEHNRAQSPRREEGAISRTLTRGHMALAPSACFAKWNHVRGLLRLRIDERVELRASVSNVLLVRDVVAPEDRRRLMPRQLHCHGL